jgi:hypothetical protein
MVEAQMVGAQLLLMRRFCISPWSTIALADCVPARP